VYHDESGAECRQTDNQRCVSAGARIDNNRHTRTVVLHTLQEQNQQTIQSICRHHTAETKRCDYVVQRAVAHANRETVDNVETTRVVRATEVLLLRPTVGQHARAAVEARHHRALARRRIALVGVAQRLIARQRLAFALEQTNTARTDTLARHTM
jgi:hypothetical protein